MSIFEDKHHNDPAYVGQKPVRSIMVPDDVRDTMRKQSGEAQPMGAGRLAVASEMSTRNLPNKD